RPAPVLRRHHRRTWPLGRQRRTLRHRGAPRGTGSRPHEHRGVRLLALRSLAPGGPPMSPLRERMDPELAALTERRGAELFEEHRQAIFVRTDRLFAGLLVLEWLFGIFIAFVVSPRAWAGSQSQVHPHVFAALLLGGAIISLPAALGFLQPGRTLT